MTIPNRRIRPLAAAALAAAGATLVGTALMSAPASARVGVDPATAAAGGYATVHFTVTNDRADATTTKLTVRLPAAHPVAGVSTRPTDGWAVAVEGSPVTAVTWTATTDAAAIAPGTFELFSISLGPLPTDLDTLAFSAAQTYSDGAVANWSGEPGAAGPAPALALDAGAPAPDPPAPTPTPEPTALTAVETVAADLAAPGAEENAAAPRVILGLAVGAGLLLAGVAGSAFVRRGEGDASPPPAS